MGDCFTIQLFVKQVGCIATHLLVIYIILIGKFVTKGSFWGSLLCW